MAYRIYLGFRLNRKNTKNRPFEVLEKKKKQQSDFLSFLKRISVPLYSGARLPCVLHVCMKKGKPY